MVAFASILLAAVGAMAQTTNALSDTEIRGRQLAQQLLEQSPATNFTQNGILKIRDKKGSTTNVLITFQTLTTAGYWQTRYEARHGTNTDSLPVVILSIIGHYPTDLPKNYFLCEDERGLPPTTLVQGKSFAMNPLYTDTVPFAGSDFSLADLGLEFFHWPGQNILRGETMRGLFCKVLESTNPNPPTNGYSRVVTWIDNESLGIVQAKAYDAKGKLLKEFLPKDVKKVNGQWQVGSMDIRNVQTGSRTRLEFDLKKQ
jgi:hypothetical protein